MRHGFCPCGGMCLVWGCGLVVGGGLHGLRSAGCGSQVAVVFVGLVSGAEPARYDLPDILKFGCRDAVA